MINFFQPDYKTCVVTRHIINQRNVDFIKDCSRLCFFDRIGKTIIHLITEACSTAKVSTHRTLVMGNKTAWKKAAGKLFLLWKKENLAKARGKCNQQGIYLLLSKEYVLVNLFL
jgi:hypothetical protein